MKGLIIGVVLVMLGLLVGCVGSNGAEDDVATGNIHMEATINGLEEGEEAVLCLARNTVDSDEVLLEKNITGNGEAITVELNTNLEDSYYKLVLEAPGKYFRDPKGYSFQVWESEIVNPTGMLIVFDLIPPSALNLLEATVSLSAPERDGELFEPLVAGEISGLATDELFAIDIFTADDEEIAHITCMGNGRWEGGIQPNKESSYYTIIAEAEGYSVEPESYRVVVEDEIVYVVEDGEVGEEALHLDFHFSAE